MKFSHAVSAVLKREMIRYRSSWIYPFISFIGPLLSFFIIYHIFSVGVTQNQPVGVIDSDHTGLSRKAIHMIDATPIANVNTHFQSLQEGRIALEDGKIEALVVLPAGFEKAILRGEKAQPVLYINNTNVLKGGMLQSGIYKALATFSVGIEVNIAMKKGAFYSQAMHNAMPVNVDSHVLFNPYTNYAYFLAGPLFFLMVIAFSLLGSIYVIGREIKEGTSSELYQLADENMCAVLVGKLLPYTLFMTLMMMVVNVVLFQFMHAPLNGNFAYLIAGQLILIVAYQMLGVLFLALTANMRLSLSIGSAYGMMALTFSGLTFPLIGMPLLARWFSFLFPYSYWIRIFIGQSMRYDHSGRTLIFLNVMGLFILFSWLFMGRLRKIFVLNHFHGKL